MSATFFKGGLRLKAFVFDVLYKDGISLLEQPLVERLQILDATIAPGDILVPTEHHLVRDATTLSLLFEEAISKGLEGLVVKKPDSPYEAELIELYHSQGQRMAR